MLYQINVKKTCLVETTYRFSLYSEYLNKNNKNIHKFTNDKQKKCITTALGNGDGIVPLESLLIPKIWDMSDDKLVFHHIPNREHSSILLL